MGETIGKLRHLSKTQLGFDCPGCEELHIVRIGANGWTWNGNHDAPTFFPSVKVTCGHYAPGWNGNACWCTYDAEHPEDPSGFKCGICHSFVTDGKIQFLSDCTHALAGKTVELPPWQD